MVNDNLNAKYAAPKKKYAPNKVPPCQREKAAKEVMGELRPQLENNTVRCGAGEYTKGVGLDNARNVKGPPL